MSIRKRVSTKWRMIDDINDFSFLMRMTNSNSTDEEITNARCRVNDNVGKIKPNKLTNRSAAENYLFYAFSLCFSFIEFQRVRWKKIFLQSAFYDVQKLWIYRFCRLKNSLACIAYRLEIDGHIWIETHVALQLNDFVKQLKSTKFTGESEWTQVLLIASRGVGFLRVMLDGVRKHWLPNAPTTRWTIESTRRVCKPIYKYRIIS